MHSVDKRSLQTSAGQAAVPERSPREDARFAIAMMGARAATRIPTATLQHLGEWLDWPGWLCSGTSLAGRIGPLPAMLSRADDILIMANIVENADIFVLVEAMLTRPRPALSLAGELAVLHGPDLGSSITMVARGLGARNSWVGVDTREHARQFEIALRPAWPMGALFDSFALCALTLLQRSIVAYRGEQLAGMCIMTHHHDIPEAQAALAAFHCRIEPAGEANALCFPRSWLDQANPYFDPLVWDVACAKLAALENEVLATEASNPLRDFIVEQLDQMRRVPRLKQAAAHLGMSTRTIVRSLARQDTSFHKLVEEERKARALALLADTSLSLKDVADALGFSDMSSFGRSFRNWFGDTPGNLRKEAAQTLTAVSQDAPRRRSLCPSQGSVGRATARFPHPER